MYTNKLFTIGQFAALHEINKKTLMWYDEIGLLKPAFVKENGYRYYTYHQSSILETILILRELDVSLGEIQDFMKNRSASSLEVLLEDKIEELDHTISRLQAVRQMLSGRQKDLHTLIHMDLSEISIIEKEKTYLITVPVMPGESYENSIEKVIAEAKKYQLHRLHDAAYGSMISVENLVSGRPREYSSLFIEMPNPKKKAGLHVQPRGRYLRAFCKGNWENIPARQEEILCYANAKGLHLYGYAYEMGINEMVIDSIDDYITKIEIPILES